MSVAHIDRGVVLVHKAIRVAELMRVDTEYRLTMRVAMPYNKTPLQCCVKCVMIWLHTSQGGYHVTPIRVHAYPSSVRRTLPTTQPAVTLF